MTLLDIIPTTGPSCNWCSSPKPIARLTTALGEHSYNALSAPVCRRHAKQLLHDLHAAIETLAQLLEEQNP
jgi:hypothetical protein